MEVRPQSRDRGELPAYRAYLIKSLVQLVRLRQQPFETLMTVNPLRYSMWLVSPGAV